MSPAKKKAPRGVRQGIRGDRVLAARHARRLSVLQTMIGVQLYPGKLSEIENNRTDLTGSVIRRLALGIPASTDYLFGLSDSIEVRSPTKSRATLDARIRHDAHGLVGARVRKVRKMRGLTLGELYAITGIRPGVLSRVENEKQDLLGRQILRIAHALNASMDFLFGISDAMARGK